MEDANLRGFLDQPAACRVFVVAAGSFGRRIFSPCLSGGAIFSNAGAICHVSYRQFDRSHPKEGRHV
jgi:hypothetical protein